VRKQPLAEILEAAELNPVLHLLRVWGPGKLLALLTDKGYGARLPKRFVVNGTCHLCYTLMADEVLCAAMRELAADPELAAPLYLNLLEALSRRLTGTRLQLLDLFTMAGTEPW
jgi:hypothetical protein